MVFFKWDAVDKKLLSALSMFSWFTVLCYVISFLDILQIPVFLALSVLFIAACICHNDSQSKIEGELQNSKIDLTSMQLERCITSHVTYVPIILMKMKYVINLFRTKYFAYQRW